MAVSEATEDTRVGLIGKTIGRYRVTGELGRGGMATVYRAHDPQLGRDVAIKVMHGAFAGRADLEARFRREARAVAAIKHDGIVDVYDFAPAAAGEPGYIVTEIVEGPTLRSLVEQHGGRLLPEATALFAARIAGALGAAHARGIVHRDVKPDNVMFDLAGAGPVRVLLTDFGIAHMTEAETMTATGAIVGSPIYMSPEQARGQEILPASDVFSLGVMLYHVTTGRPPFAGRDPLTAIAAILKGEFLRPSQVDAHVEPGAGGGDHAMPAKRARRAIRRRARGRGGAGGDRARRAGAGERPRHRHGAAAVLRRGRGEVQRDGQPARRRAGPRARAAVPAAAREDARAGRDQPRVRLRARPSRRAGAAGDDLAAAAPGQGRERRARARRGDRGGRGDAALARDATGGRRRAVRRGQERRGGRRRAARGSAGLDDGHADAHAHSRSSNDDADCSRAVARATHLSVSTASKHRQTARPHVEASAVPGGAKEKPRPAGGSGKHDPADGSCEAGRDRDRTDGAANGGGSSSPQRWHRCHQGDRCVCPRRRCRQPPPARRRQPAHGRRGPAPTASLALRASQGFCSPSVDDRPASIHPSYDHLAPGVHSLFCTLPGGMKVFVATYDLHAGTRPNLVIVPGADGRPQLSLPD